MTDSEYKTFLNANSVVSSSDNNAEIVRHVGTRIASAIKKYYDAKGQNSDLEGYQWEFNLLNNKELYVCLKEKRSYITVYCKSQKH